MKVQNNKGRCNAKTKQKQKTVIHTSVVGKLVGSWVLNDVKAAGEGGATISKTRWTYMQVLRTLANCEG